MSVCSYLYHEYMQAFCPSLESLSYVDNLLGVGKGAFDVAVGLNVARCFCETLALELDDCKTYAWSTDRQQRSILQALRIPVVASCRELGGVISFGPATRNRPLVQRCESLAPLFGALRRSKAPWHTKLSALPTKFWSLALRGIAACPVSDSLLQSLRTQTVRALRAAPAGASPVLRLSLSLPMTADPGFWQCWNCLTTVRRLCQKQPRLTVLWADFMTRYDGRLFHGPFSKLLVVLGSIGWQIGAPPILVDEEGLSHNLLHLPLPALRAAAERAWLRSVAQAHAHRASMAGLQGIDAALAQLDISRLSPTERARVAALQSGALMFAEAQSRFDLTRSGLCPRCGIPDTKEHRLRDCPLFAAAREGHMDVLARWDALPPCLKFHLLPPANPAAVELRSLLQQIPDGSCSFFARPTSGVQHLFTDGACSRPCAAELSVAAWSVISATDGVVIATDHLPGLLQTAPRAELFALLSAVSWIRFFGVQGVIWGDSLSAVEGLSLILAGQAPADKWNNLDLWQRIWEQLAELEPGQLRTQHVPSHLDAELCETEFEEWVARWNQYADTTACCTNANRTGRFLEVQQQAIAYYEDTAHCLRSLRSVYLNIADQAGPADTPHDHFDEPEEIDFQEAMPPGLERTDMLVEVLPLSWQAELTVGMTPGLSGQACRLWRLILEQDASSIAEYCLSWLELVAVIWVLDPDVWRTQTSSDARIPVRSPTVAEQLRHLRRSGAHFLKTFGLTHLRVYRISKVSLGFGFPLDGIRVGVSIAVLQRAQALLRDFSSGRFCRTVADIERHF